MTQALTTQRTGPLATLSQYSDDELALVKQTVAVGCTDLQLAYFLEVSRRRRLDPWKRQIYAILRAPRQGEPPVLVIQTGIDGFRLIAARSNAYAGSDEPRYGPMVRSDGIDHPETASVTVYRIVQGIRCPFVGTVSWDERVQKVPGTARLMGVWGSQPKLQLAKCAEAIALRKGFPEELQELEYDGDTVDTVTGEITGAPRTLPAAQQPARQPSDYAMGHVATPTAPVALVATHEWLSVCPEHGVPWKMGQFGLSHPTDAQSPEGKTLWCTSRRVLTQMLAAAVSAAGIDEAQARDIAKERWNKVPSALSDTERIEAIGYYQQRLAELAPVNDKEEEEELQL